MLNSNSDQNTNNTKNRNYIQLKLLGEGSFGKAFLVESSSDKVRNK